MELMTIEVQGMRVFAGHGVHDEESLSGNEFEISASVSFVPEGKITSLSHTIDYVKLSEILKAEMKARKQLLETIAGEIAEKIRITFPIVTKVSVNIKKLTPPIANFTGAVGVTYSSE